MIAADLRTPGRAEQRYRDNGGRHPFAALLTSATVPCGSMRKDAMPETLQFIDVGHGVEARAIAVRAHDGAPPGLFWLGGFKSDMRGTKAAALARFAEERGRALVRFDYSGHGESRGVFTDGTIG